MAGRTSQTVGTKALYGVDSGVHSCTVIDDIGNYGTASITVKITGKTLFVCYFVELKLLKVLLSFYQME